MEFYSKYWKNQKKYTEKLEKNTGKVREIWQPVVVKTLQILYHTLNKKELQKSTEKTGKYWKN